MTAKSNTAAESQQILEAIKSYPSGATLTNIMDDLGFTLSRRTVQRRLTELKAQKRIFSTGAGRAIRYFSTKSQENLIDLTGENYIKLSVSGDEIRQQISKPLKVRKRTTYQKNFLEKYIPNHSAYLKPSLRNHLLQISQSNHEKLPAGTFAKQIFDRLLIDLSWNSSRLEGNTYSLLDTERLIRAGKTAEGKNLFETRMILNHKAAIEFLLEAVDELKFDRYTILSLHALLSKNLLGDPAASGRLRSIPVGIGKTTYQPLSVPQSIEEYFQKILNTANLIHDPFEQSFFAMVHLPYLQPFIDVNKRVSRLAANIPLIVHNLCPISFVDVPNQAYIDGILGVYELNRVELLSDVYAWAYEKSALRYNEAQAYLRQPEEFSEQYDTKIRTLIHKIVIDCLDTQQANQKVIVWSKNHIPQKDQVKFIEVVETQLLALHEGNIVNYKIKPHEYVAWKKIWN